MEEQEGLEGEVEEEYEEFRSPIPDPEETLALFSDAKEYLGSWLWKNLSNPNPVALATLIAVASMGNIGERIAHQGRTNNILRKASLEWQASYEIERNERAEAENRAELLRSENEQYRENMQSFFILSRSMEAHPLTFDRSRYQPLVEEHPELEVMVDALLPIAERLREEGHFVFHPNYYFAKMMQESSGKNPWVEGRDGTVRVTRNKRMLKAYFISNRCAVGPTQIIPETGKELGMRVIEHESCEEGFRLHDQWKRARKAVRRAESAVDWYKRKGVDVDKIRLSEYKKRLSNYQKLRTRADSLRNLRDTKFGEYEDMVADSIAGKTIAELREFEQRMTPGGAARGMILLDSRNHPWHESDYLKSSAMYFSGSSDELRSYNARYSLEVRRWMNHFFELTNPDFKYQLEVPVIASADAADIKTAPLSSP